MRYISCFMSVCLLALGFPSFSSAQETFSFPARASDIPSDANWTVNEFSEGAFIMDLNVRRWSGGSWRGSSGGSANSANYDWDVPLYAPASGFIVSCWRNFPDHPTAGGTHPDFPSRIFGGGNFVYIVTDEGNGISINHLKSGSLPAHLCPVNAGNAAYPNTTRKEGDWRVAAYIDDPADWVRIEEGEFIGTVGNSGRSSGPHLHISSQPVLSQTGDNGRIELGDAQAMRFRNVWGHGYDHDSRPDAEDWYRWRGAEFTGNPDCDGFSPNTPSCRYKSILPSPFLRRATASAGTVASSMDTLFVSQNRMVTATIGQSDGRLKLIAWDLVGLDQINRRGDLSDGIVKDVHLARTASNMVLAAVRQTDDRLRMAAFRVGPFGTLSKVAEKTYGKISWLDMAEIPGVNKRAVAAMRTNSGELKLIAFDTSTVIQDGETVHSINRLGEIGGPAISAVAVSHTRSFSGVYAAQRLSDGTLKVTPYQLSSSGMRFTAGTPASAGSIGNSLDVAPLPSGVAVSVRDGQGRLRTMSWGLDSAGNLDPQRKATVVDFAVSQIELMTTPHGASNLAGIVRNGNGDLELVGFAADDDGSNLRRLGASRAGGISGLAAAAVSRSYSSGPRDMIVTAVRDDDAGLRLITWDTNLNAP